MKALIVPHLGLAVFQYLYLITTAAKAETTSYNNNTDSSNFSKRGLIYIDTSHTSDYGIFTSTNPKTPLTWYYNYATSPSLETNGNEAPLEFVPMVHSTNDASAAVDTIQSLASSSSGSNQKSTHVLTYNEPDGSTSSGGSNIDPHDAAKTYLELLSPLREDPWNLSLSTPATTGSSRGLDWLQKFNSACLDLNPPSSANGHQGGCQSDFVAVHWYGDFASLASWMGTLHSMYPRLPMWVTEFAIPSASQDVTLAMLNQSLPYLDSLDYVDRYAWFGTFRDDSGANEWTGNNVAMLDGNGGLTQLGALYMGGENRGFKQGMSSSSSSSNAATGRTFSVMFIVIIGTIGVLFVVY